MVTFLPGRGRPAARTSGSPRRRRAPCTRRTAPPARRLRRPSAAPAPSTSTASRAAPASPPSARWPGKKVTTIEGLGADRRAAHPVQQRLDRGGRGAVRLLPVGPDHVARRRCSRRSRDADDADIDAAMTRQPLPLRHLPAHPRRRPPRGRPAGKARRALTAAPATLPPRLPEGLGRHRRRARDRLRRAAGERRVASPRRPPAAAPSCPRPTPSCASARRAASPSSSPTPRWARASGPRCRCWSPRSSTSTGRRSASSTRRRRPPTRHTAFGIQMTGGSTSTWSEFDRYRQAGALARALLVAAAARSGASSPADCRTENGVVSTASDRARATASWRRRPPKLHAAGDGDAQGRRRTGR